MMEEIKMNVAYVIRALSGKEFIMMLFLQEGYYYYFVDSMGQTVRVKKEGIIREATDADVMIAFLQNCIKRAQKLKQDFNM